MVRRAGAAGLMMVAAVLLAGCPKGNSDFNAGKKAEALQDYDTALIHYERALKSDPKNVDYKLKATRLRFEAGQAHVDAGRKQRDKGDLQMALAEFEKAAAIDPSNPVAPQEVRATLELIGKQQAGRAATAPPGPTADLTNLDTPVELKPISRDRINLKVTNDAKIVFDTVAKLAGFSVIYDPDYQSRRITVELTNVTLEDALDVVGLQAKAFWKPLTSNIVIVAADQTQKRKDLEDNVVRTFYLNNTIQAQDLTEVVNNLRQILDLRKIQQVNSQNAIVIRDTPDKVLLAEKIIRDIDRAKPEVVIQVSVLQARRDRMRDLGITPGTSSVLSFTPRNPTSTGSTGTGTGTSSGSSNQIRLNDLQRLSSADYSLTLPGATLNALMTDSMTKIIQNPEIRVVDGQAAKLRIGDRVPIATGSFGGGLGAVGTTGTTGVGYNPLVNTQFQYQDVGVNIDITPRIHPNREVSMKVSIDVSSVAGRVNIGGIEQPIFSQRKIDHDIRLMEGEVSVLGGIVERSETNSVSGWPGLAKIPFLRYFFSGEHKESVEAEVLIVLRPRVVRIVEISELNTRTISSGTETNVRVRQQSTEAPPPQAVQPAAGQAPARPTPPPAQTPESRPAATEPSGPARVRFEPATINLKPGETTTVAVVVENVRDLFSIPLIVQFNQAVVSIEEVRHGGFLSGGTQEIAIVHRVDKERGNAIISATRQPNTAGVNGTGTLVGIVLKGIAAGSSNLSIVQVSARDSQQKAITMVSSEATVRVQ